LEKEREREREEVLKDLEIEISTGGRILKVTRGERERERKRESMFVSLCYAVIESTVIGRWKKKKKCLEITCEIAG